MQTHHFTAPDGTDLAWTETGEGRPVILIHGYVSSANVNWIKYGHAAAIAAKGFRIIMPDLRGHGLSARPHDPAAYPPDILADDGFALVDHLGLTDYDLGGYSLGARTTARMLARGASPRRAIIGGMGLEGLTAATGRKGHFHNILTHPGTFERGTPEWNVDAFVKTTKGDPVALLNILDTFVDTPRAEIAAIAIPTLVVAGVDDDDNGSTADLADLIPDAKLVVTPGGHMSAIVKPEFGRAIVDFLAG